MRDFFEKLTEKAQKFMSDRYGQDEFSLFIYSVSIIILCINCFLRIRILNIFAYVCAAGAICRSLSKNLSRRNEERNAFLGFVSKISNGISHIRIRWRDRKTHKYFKCECGAMLRVPKGKGKIEITCPKCGKKKIKKT